MNSVDFLKSKYASWGISAPVLHTVLGSGLSEDIDKVVSGAWKKVGEFRFKDVPDFASSTVQGHPGLYQFYQDQRSGKVFSLQLGRLHGYEGLEPRQVVQSVTQIFDAGTQHFLITNAAGALQKEFEPGSLMILEDQVNFTGKNPLVGHNPKLANGQDAGPRFPDMVSLFDPKLSAKLEGCLQKKFQVHRGIYIGVLGPSFETPAEVRLFSKWGMGAVGMSTVWETIALKHRGAKLAGLSMLSNFGSGLVGAQPLDHSEVLAQGKKSARALLGSLFEFFHDVAGEIDNEL
jgi:purine-nucleoside phosphorylase